MAQTECFVVPYLTGTHMLTSQVTAKPQWYSGSQGMHSCLYATCGLIPHSSSSYIQLSVCLFTVPQRLRTAPGMLRQWPNDPLPYRGWHLAVNVSVHPSFFCIYSMCTYSQVASLGLVSLQILFGEIASWLVCGTLSICQWGRIRNKPS